MANPQRVAKLAREIQRVAANTLLYGLTDPRIAEANVTVTRVKLSNDLAHAKIYYSVLGSDVERRKVHACLEHARGRVRDEIAHGVEMRQHPAIDFFYDEAVQGVLNLEEAFKKIAEERGPDEPDTDSTGSNDSTEGSSTSVTASSSEPDHPDEAAPATTAPPADGGQAFQPAPNDSVHPVQTEQPSEASQGATGTGEAPDRPPDGPR